MRSARQEKRTIELLEALPWLPPDLEHRTMQADGSQVSWVGGNMEGFGGREHLIQRIRGANLIPAGPPSWHEA